MADTTGVSKKDHTKEMTFLWEVSNTLASSHFDDDETQGLLLHLKEIFQKYFQVNTFRIFVRDESTSTLRDFVKSWIIIEKNQQQELVENIFNRLKTLGEKGFILNNKVLKYSSKSSTLFENSNRNKNLMYFPVFNEKKLTGVIEINFDGVNEDVRNEEFLTALRIAMAQISTVVVNKILNRHLVANIKFQHVMKSIAKLIETQFELNYILPIIGELIDRFVCDHLIYIFTKDEDGKYKLFWPLDCQDESVLKLLPKMKESKSHIISKDGKTGLFAIRNEERTMGVIAASSNIDKLSKTEIDYLCQLSAQASVTTQRANSYAQVLKYATLDALTGLNNRRQFEVRLKQESANAGRNKKPLCCIMLDIDYFKKVNDTWGHSAGDCVLKNVAKIVAQGLREYDIASRYGGEEFCILLPDTKIREAVFVAQRLRAAVEKADINISEDQVLGVDTLKVTISVGVSEYNEYMETPERLHQSADIALYEAKRRGRNRVVVYDEGLE